MQRIQSQIGQKICFYIHLKKYEYNEGGAIDADKLMSHAENQYLSHHT